MDHANGSNAAASTAPVDTPALAPERKRNTPGLTALAPGFAQQPSVTPLTPTAPHKPARQSPYHVHGSVLEGGDSPAVLAQPAAVAAQGQGSRFHPERRSRGFVERGRRAKDVVVMRYRDVSDDTDDFVHDNPWKSIAFAALGGLIIGLLVSRRTS